MGEGVKLLKKWREFLEGGMKMTIFLKKGNHPSGQMDLRADGPPGRWTSGQMDLRADGRRTSGIRRSRKQKAERGKEESDRKSLRNGIYPPEWQVHPEWSGSLHLFSIGNYFHLTLLPESNIKPKIII